MTTEYDAAELERYGFRILPNGRFFSIAKGTELGVVHSKKRGRHVYHSTSGTKLASGMDPVAFVKQFWHATAKNPTSRRRRGNPPTEVHEEYARKYLAETDDILGVSKRYFESGDRAQGFRYLLDAFETVSEGNAELVHLLEDPAFDTRAAKHLLDDLSALQESIRSMLMQGLASDPGSARSVGPRLQVIDGGRSGNPHEPYKTKAPFLIKGRWRWVTWTHHGPTSHAAILAKAEELGAQAWDFGQSTTHPLSQWPTSR